MSRYLLTVVLSAEAVALVLAFHRWSHQRASNAAALAFATLDARVSGKGRVAPEGAKLVQRETEGFMLSPSELGIELEGGSEVVVAVLSSMCPECESADSALSILASENARGADVVALIASQDTELASLLQDRKIRYVMHETGRLQSFSGPTMIRASEDLRVVEISPLHGLAAGRVNPGDELHGA